MLRLSDDTNVAVQDGSLFYIYDFKKIMFIAFDPELQCCEFLDSCVFLSDIEDNTSAMYKTLSCHCVLISSSDMDKFKFKKIRFQN